MLILIIDVEISFLQGRLNELMSQIRMQAHGGGHRSEARYTLDDNLRLEIKQVGMLVFKQILNLNLFVLFTYKVNLRG